MAELIPFVDNELEENPLSPIWSAVNVGLNGAWGRGYDAGLEMMHKAIVDILDKVELCNMTTADIREDADRLLAVLREGGE